MSDRPFRVIVCGSREWQDGARIHRALHRVLECYPDREIVIVDGQARGADLFAGDFDDERVSHDRFPADWRLVPKAGPIRNLEMLAAGADLVLAFKDGFDYTLARGGTEHMVMIARAAGVETHVISHAGC